MEVAVRKAMLAPRFKNNMKSMALQTASLLLFLTPWMKVQAFMGKQISRRMSAKTRLKRKILFVLDFQNLSLKIKRWMTDAFRGKAKIKITIIAAAQNLYTCISAASSSSRGCSVPLVLSILAVKKQIAWGSANINSKLENRNRFYPGSIEQSIVSKVKRKSLQRSSSILQSKQKKSCQTGFLGVFSFGPF